jgi:hypothetical protein
MPTIGRPKITVRLDEHELRQFQASAHNAGTSAAELARLLILTHIGEPRAAMQARHALLATLDLLDADRVRDAVLAVVDRWSDSEHGPAGPDVAQLLGEIRETLTSAPERPAS